MDEFPWGQLITAAGTLGGAFEAAGVEFIGQNGSAQHVGVTPATIHRQS